MTTERAKRPWTRVDNDIRAAIADQLNLYGGKCTAAEIYRYLHSQEDFRGRLPELRSVQRLVKEYRKERDTQEWHWSNYEPEDARILLDVYAGIASSRSLTASLVEGQLDVDGVYDTLPPDFFEWATDPEGGEPLKVKSPGFLWLEIPENFLWAMEFADWVIKVHKVCPGIGDQAVFQIARHYLVASRLGVSTEKLDLFIARKPWETFIDLFRYVNVLYNGKASAFSIPGAHLRILLSVAESLYKREIPDKGVNGDEGLKHLNENFAKLLGLIWSSAKWGSDKGKEDEG